MSEKIHIHGEEHTVYPTSLEIDENKIASTIIETKIEKQTYTEFEKIPFGRIIGARSGDKGVVPIWEFGQDLMIYILLSIIT